MSWYTKVGLHKPDPYAHVPRRRWVMGVGQPTSQDIEGWYEDFGRWLHQR